MLIKFFPDRLPPSPSQLGWGKWGKVVVLLSYGRPRVVVIFKAMVGIRQNERTYKY